MSSRWLEVPRDERSSLHSPASCMVLADLSGDGDVKLVGAHVESYIGNSKVKLKVSFLYDYTRLIFSSKVLNPRE